MRRWALLALGVAALPAGLARGAQTQTVTASGTSFTPKTITINAGDSVRWQNAGGFHSVDFDDPSVGVDTAASSNPDMVTHEFDTPGTYTYHCEVHGAAGGVGMSGTVVVQGPAVTPAPTASPTPTPTYVLPRVTALGVVPRIAQHGRLRGFVRATPALQRVRVSATPGRHAVVRARASLRRTSFSVRLTPATVRAARRGKHPRVRVTASAGASSRSRVVRLRR